MMGEDEILAAAVQIELDTQVALGHRRALDVPARAPRPPGAVPGRLAWHRRLPDWKVQRILLQRVVRVFRELAVDREHPRPVEPAERPVLRDARHPKVDGALANVCLSLV